MNCLTVRTSMAVCLAFTCMAVSLTGGMSEASADTEQPTPAAEAEKDKEKNKEKNVKREDDGEKAQTSQSEPAKPSVPDKSGESGDDVVLTVASWGGAYEKSQALAYFKPFSEETGIAIKSTSHGGDFSSLVSGGQVSWDVVDLSLETAEKACDNGHIERIDPADLAPAPDGTAAKEDFLADSLRKCAVASMAWSSVLVYDKKAFAKKAPKSLKDFFNTKSFPGKRALQKSPRYTLELALLADDVAPEDVYQRLGTEDGLAQALSKLSELRDHIVWWTQPSEPMAMLTNGEAVMASAYSGRAFFVVTGKKRPFGLVWDGQIFDVDLWAIPKSAKHKEAALKFIAYATKPERLAEQTKWFPYGPMRKSAVSLVSRHAEAGIEMAPYIPTSKKNFTRALRLDTLWWEKNQDRISQRFIAWLEKPEPSQTLEGNQEEQAKDDQKQEGNEDKAGNEDKEEKAKKQ